MKFKHKHSKTLLYSEEERTEVGCNYEITLYMAQINRLFVNLLTLAQMITGPQWNRKLINRKLKKKKGYLKIIYSSLHNHILKKKS